MALRLRLSDESDTSSEEEEKEEVQGNIILGWGDRPTIYSSNVYEARPTAEPDLGLDLSLAPLPSLAPPPPQSKVDDQDFELRYGQDGKPLRAPIIDEEEEEEEGEEEEKEESDTDFPMVYRPQLAVIQPTQSEEPEKAAEEEKGADEISIEVVEENEKEEEEDEAIKYPTFIPAYKEPPPPKEAQQPAASSSSLSASASAPTLASQELINRNDHRFLRRPVVRTEALQRVETVFCCAEINRCAKALWGWPYPIWPKYVFLRFTVAGGQHPITYCMNHQNGTVHFGRQPLFPEGTEERAYPLNVDEPVKEQLFQYCAEHNAAVYDRWEERLSVVPMLGERLVGLWRLLPASREATWATSYSLIYAAFCRAIFAHSQLAHPKQMASLAEFFLFIEETAQDRV